MILIISPVLLLTIFMLKFTGEGEIFYLQKRVGKNKKTIYVYKFVTMLKNSPSMGSGIYTAKGDPRILPVGKFLRKSKINELPQLFNVLLGHMSVVGPRPLIKETFEFYENETQEKISQNRPGITGIGSIVFRDEESILQKTEVSNLESYYKNNIAPYKGKLEIWYHENKSFTLDLQLILITGWIILFPKSNLYEKLFSDLPKRSF